MAFKDFLSNIANGLGGLMEGFGFSDQARDFRSWFNKNVNHIDINEVNNKAMQLVNRAKKDYSSKQKLVDAINNRIDSVSTGSWAAQNSENLSQLRKDLSKAEESRNKAETRLELANNATYAAQQGMQSGNYKNAQDSVEQLADAYEKSI